MDTAEHAATLLLDAWAAPARPLAALPEALRPRDERGMYAIQAAVRRGLGPNGGWKVGRPGPESPYFCAPMPASRIQPSPGLLPAAFYTLRGVEAEIAFRLGADLPPRPEPWPRDAVLAAIASCHPAIEVLQSRFADPDALDKLTALADGNAHGGFIFGAPIEGWREEDFPSMGVRLIVNGDVVKTGRGNPAGDMIAMIAWLAGPGSAFTGGLHAGDFITCGSWTGKTLVASGARVEVAFDGAGPVVAEFVDEA